MPSDTCAPRLESNSCGARGSCCRSVLPCQQGKHEHFIVTITITQPRRKSDLSFLFALAASYTNKLTHSLPCPAYETNLKRTLPLATANMSAPVRLVGEPSKFSLASLAAVMSLCYMCVRTSTRVSNSSLFKRPTLHNLLRSWRKSRIGSLAHPLIRSWHDCGDPQ